MNNEETTPTPETGPPPATSERQQWQLTFEEAKDAPKGSLWPHLPDGGRFRPILKGQRVTNPKRQTRALTRLGGRQWRKLRKALNQLHAAKLGMSTSEVKRIQRRGEDPREIAQMRSNLVPPVLPPNEESSSTS